MKRSTYLMLVITVTLVICFLFAACAKPAPAPSPVPAPTPKPTPAPTPKPTIEKIILPSLPPGTSWYAMQTTLSQMINKNTDMVAVVEPVTSPGMFHELLKAGKAHIMIEQATETWHAYNGDWGATWVFGEKEGPYKGHRLLMGLNNNYYDFITGKFTGIKTIPDLKGKKISMKYPTLPCGMYSAMQLRAYGLDPEKDVEMVSHPFTTHALKDLEAKKIHAVSTSMGGAKVVEVDAKVGAVWLPFDPAKIGFVQSIESQVQAGIAQPYIPGVKEPTPVIYIRNYLVAENTVPDEVAYNAVKVICEHAKDYTRLTWEFQEWTKERAIIPNTFIPYHPGAIKYFKEQGMWTDELDSLQKKLLPSGP